MSIEGKHLMVGRTENAAASETGLLRINNSYVSDRRFWLCLTYPKSLIPLVLLPEIHEVGIACTS